MKIKLKRLNDAAKMPIYATPGSGCFDLFAAIDTPTHVALGEPANIATGLAFELPTNHVMLIFSRSGHGFKNGIRLANCTGVIDSDYRNEVMVKLTADQAGSAFIIRPGDRIAQAMIIPRPWIDFEFAEDLSDTERTGGFGSSGA